MTAVKVTRAGATGKYVGTTIRISYRRISGVDQQAKNDDDSSYDPICKFAKVCLTRGR